MSDPPAADVLIVGAGIAGLAAAWELVKRGQRPVVLEQSARAGGVILTEHRDGFVIDGGPDALLVQKPAAIDLCRELGIGARLFPTTTPRTAYVLRRGKLIALPEASFMGLPTRIAPFVTTPLFSWRAKARMALELVVPRRRNDGDEAIGTFMRRRFGREMVDVLADPLFAGIHAGDVDRLSIRSTFPRLAEMERTRGSVLRALPAMRPPSTAQDRGAFMSLPGGIQELVDALVAQLPAGTIRFDAQVTAIEKDGTYRVSTARGDAFAARAVVVAAPAWAAATLMEPVDRGIARLCQEVSYTSTATIAFALRREQVRHPLEGSGYVVPRSERHAVMAATWVSSKWPQRAPDGFALLRAFVGGAYDPGALTGTDSELARIAFADLAGTLDITGDPLFARVYRWPRSSAQHEVGHLARMADIDRRLAAHPGLFVTGSGFRGTGIPDCVADGRATAARAAEYLAAGRW